MHSLKDLYEEPTVLSSQCGHHRIYAQVAYKAVRERRCVPVLISEAIEIVPSLPLCWLSSNAGPILIALRHLLPEDKRQLAASSEANALLPMALQAFPLIPPDLETLEHHQLLFDKAIADEPTDVGAPILMANGKLSYAALVRAKLAIDFGRAWPTTAALSHRLASEGLLEPWPLDFDLGHGAHITIDKLLVVTSSGFDEDVVSTIVRDFGVEAGLFLSLHRASLFRVANLLTKAKRSIAKAGPGK